MRPVTRLARALLGAFWTAVDSESDTDRGFIKRAEQILDREEQRRRALDDTPRTTRVTFAGNGPNATSLRRPDDRQAKAS